MKTLADFKKAIKLGVKLHALHHNMPYRDVDTGEVKDGEKDLGIREVTVAQSNAFALKTTKSDGRLVDSWWYYSKAADHVFDGDSVTIWDNNYKTGWDSNNNPIIEKRKIITYTIVKDNG